MIGSSSTMRIYAVAPGVPWFVGPFPRTILRVEGSTKKYNPAETILFLSYLSSPLRAVVKSYALDFHRQGAKYGKERAREGASIG